MSRAERLAAVYARIPDARCKGLCAAACGPIGCTPAERVRIERAGGKKLTHDPETLSCSMLVDGRCSVYEKRPLICRLYGSTVGLRCEHGCIPESGLLTDEQAATLLRTIVRIT